MFIYPTHFIKNICFSSNKKNINIIIAFFNNNISYINIKKVMTKAKDKTQPIGFNPLG
jgi:hypothetical protein